RIAGQVFGEKRRASFLRCKPGNEARADSGCARKTLAPIARYVLRRPPSKEDLARYVALADAAAEKSGSFYKGLELSLAAMLISPQFLYIVDFDEADPVNPGARRLDAYSRAARLSFFLWNTTPNEALLGAAARGELDDPASFAKVAETMVASPRFEKGVRAFFSDMLLFEKFDEIAKDPVIYPRFSPAVAAALPEQMLRLIADELVVRDGDYRTLFTTRRTFITRALGTIYEAPVRSAYGWEPYEIAAMDDRAGLVGQAGFLALYSHSGRSSPTLRGRAVREVLLCQPVPNPPGNVNFTAVQDVHNRTFPTARDRLKAHATDPACSGCHNITDPIGLALERFDGAGVRRERENGAVIDVRAPFGEGEIIGAAGLGQALADDPALPECVAHRVFEYATGLSYDEAGERAAKTAETFVRDGRRIRALFLHVATTPDVYRVAASTASTSTPGAGR
ncbi:MAG: DUF1592 domain-containing protein, partial [Parvularculaceae bacterium]|nr:DUF1592 domain-containing protein [Parvularculaceae bacterium]